MTRPARAVILAPPRCVLAACAAPQPEQRETLASLHQVKPDTKEVAVDQGLDRAVQSYRDFLQQAPDSKQAPEAMRRLADLSIEKQFGIHGDGQLVEMPAAQGSTQPTAAAAAAGGTATAPPGSVKGAQAAQLRAPTVSRIDPRGTRSRARTAAPGSSAVSERDLEQRAAAQQLISPATGMAPLTLPGGVDADRERAGPLEAIKLYDELLAKYPHYAFRDQVLYQKARAYDELGQTDAALKVMEQLASEYPSSSYADAVTVRPPDHF